MHHRRGARSSPIPPAVLGRWWFLASVVTLAVNDHVLKRAHPGPVTGKVSDVVGPVVVATLLALAVGRSAAVAATAIGFVALKAAPGVAELAAPVLGGVTLRDPTDLIGLLALPVLWRALGPGGVILPRPTDGAQGAIAPTAAPARLRTTHHLVTAARSVVRRFVLPLAGAATASLALTATSAPRVVEIRSLAVVDHLVYAELTTYDTTDGEVTWAVSDDGGRTWEEHDGEPDLTDATLGAPDACLSDGRCVAARGDVVEVLGPEGTWTTSFSFNDNQRAVLDYRRYGGGPPIDHLFSTVVVVPSPDGETVVVGARDQGVLVMDDATPWERTSVLTADATPTGGAIWPLDLMTTFVFASLPLGVVAIVVRALIGGGTRWTILGSIVGALLIAVAIWLLGIGAWAFGTFSAQNPVLLAVLLGLLGLATIFLPLAFVRQVETEAPVPT